MFDDYGQLRPQQDNDSDKKECYFSSSGECKKSIWIEEVFHINEEFNVQISVILTCQADLVDALGVNGIEQVSK